MSIKSVLLRSAGCGIAIVWGVSAAWATYSLPTSRSVQWQGNVGVSGDIPVRTTVCATVSATGVANTDTNNINNAITACPNGQVVRLNPGTFAINAQIAIKKPITLRGAGMGRTILQGVTPIANSFLLIKKDGSSSNSNQYDITDGLTKGSTRIKTSSINWYVNSFIKINQVNEVNDTPPVTDVGTGGTCDGCGDPSRSLGQLAKVTAVNSSTRETDFEIPLYWNYNSGRAPRAGIVYEVLENAGVESLTINNTASGSSTQRDNYGTVTLWYAANSWLLDVEVIGSHRTGVRLNGTYRTTVRGCKIHDKSTSASLAEGVYGIFLNPYASANLIENNQVYNLTTGLMMNGQTSGNVIAYNYIRDLAGTVESGNQNYNMSVAGAHGAHPIMNLFEGNYGIGRLRADDVWGSSSHQVYFRNRQTISDKSYLRINVDLQKQQQFYSLVGNVLGTLGVESNYQLQGTDHQLGTTAIYRFGYQSDGDVLASDNDAQVYATTLRHSNWDAVNNSTILNDNFDTTLDSTDTDLADSLYLPAKPRWMGASVNWPPIGPDQTPMYPTAPAVGTGTPFSSVVPSYGSFGIVAGGSNYTDSRGVKYASDTYVTGGNVASFGDNTQIDNTTEDYLYQHERFGNFSYEIPVPNGKYTLTLKFAENYWNAANQRKFDVAVNGRTVLDNLDIWAEAGAKDKALDKIIPVTVTNGEINISFTTVLDNAKVNAIHIAPASDSIGVFRSNEWFLDVNGSGTWDAGDRTFTFGIAGDKPVTGDWNGNGLTKVGAVREYAWGLEWYLDMNGNGAWDTGIDQIFGDFGDPGDVPVTGDWSGSGTTKIGYFRAGTWCLDTNGNGTYDQGVDQTGSFGIPGDIPVTGDWTGTGTTKIGVFRSGAWYLDINGNATWDDGDVVHTFGITGDQPVTGNWRGTHTTKIGVKRSSTWYFDLNGNGTWDSADTTMSGFGISTDLPLAGRW